MLKALKILAISIYVVCGVMLVFFAIPKTGYRAMSVSTGSMTPAIPQGSLVFIHKTPNKSIRVGDVVTYINPLNTKQTITHRVVAYKNLGSIPGFITQGDANNAADRPILGGNIVGKVIWHVPYVGKVINWAKTPVGLSLLVIIPGILIVIDELRRLVKVLTEEQYKTALQAEKPPTEPLRASQRPSQVRQPVGETYNEFLSAAPTRAQPQTKPKGTVRRASRSMDGIKALMVIAVVMIFGANATRAALTSKATLTNNTISTAVTSGHVVISRVSFSSNACSSNSSDVSITNTGPGSTNNVTVNNNCSVTSTNNNNVSVSNQSSQTSTSGDTTSSGNTNGGSATSGSTSNSNTSSSTVSTNSTSTQGSQSFDLHNPTNASVTLSGWSITDNSGNAQAIPTTTIPAHGTVTILGSQLSSGQIGNGLVGGGDRLILKNGATTVDGLSWGSDTTVLNPAVPAIPANGSVVRTNPDFDTDQASDWTVS